MLWSHRQGERQQTFQLGNVIQAIIGCGRKRFTRSGANQRTDRKTCTGIVPHVQIVIVVADDRDL